MKKSITALLAVLLLFLGACGGEPDNHVNLKKVAKQDLGRYMPYILFAQQEKLAFVADFGFFVVDMQTGEILRTLDYKVPAYQKREAEIAARFLVAEDYNKVYYYFEDGTEENIDDVFFYYNIEEDTLKAIPVGTELAVLPELPGFSMEFAGGEQPGYTSGPIPYGEDAMVYLHVADWNVADLELCTYSVKTGETTRLPLFAK